MRALAPFGFERLEPSIEARFAEAGEELRAGAARLHAAVQGRDGGLGPPPGSAVDDVVLAVFASRRHGPDRHRLVVLARAIGASVGSLDSLTLTYRRRPIAEIAPPLLALRDAARDGAQAVAGLEQGDLPERLERFKARRSETRSLAREARRWLLTGQGNPGLALAGSDILRRADEALVAHARLAACLLRYRLA